MAEFFLNIFLTNTHSGCEQAGPNHDANKPTIIQSGCHTEHNNLTHRESRCCLSNCSVSNSRHRSDSVAYLKACPSNSCSGSGLLSLGGGVDVLVVLSVVVHWSESKRSRVLVTSATAFSTGTYKCNTSTVEYHPTL